jgi:hypothetical protein
MSSCGCCWRTAAGVAELGVLAARGHASMGLVAEAHMQFKRPYLSRRGSHDRHAGTDTAFV